MVTLRNRLSPRSHDLTRHVRWARPIILLVLIFLTAWPGWVKAQSADEGRAIYERRCSVCHGDKGSGAYWATDSLNPRPRDFTRTDPAALSREAMIDAVTHGRDGTAMTAWAGRLSAGQIAAVVNFIRSEFMSGSRKPEAPNTVAAPFPGGLAGDAAKGGVFFHANCAECHGHSGNGRGRRADMMVYKPLDFTAARTRQAFDRARLFVSIARGVPGTTMPAWSKVLSNQQIADVSEYVYRAFVEGDRAAKSNVAAADEPADAGKRTYLYYCSYCHGPKGDGRTTAAQVLDPKPRDFTAPPRLDASDVVAAVKGGRSGTAMPSFAKVLKADEIEAVAQYVTQSLAPRKDRSGRYHTPENGWPDHDARYGPAIPFATGDLAIDAPPSTLSAVQQQGLELFKGACVSCHFGTRGNRLADAGTSHMPSDYEKGVHDEVPVITDLTPLEMEGRRLYQEACAQCHAADGTGKNWIGRFLKPSPTDFNTPKFRTLVSSGAFVERTLKAPDGTSMPSFGNVLSREQVASIAAYVRRAFQGP